MLWGLWKSFGMYGIKFFLWLQSFGRITGENPWRNNPGFLYLWHTSLWAFLPVMLFVIFHLLKTFINKKLQNINLIFFLTFILLLTCLSLSKYQLPHYCFPLIILVILSVRRIETNHKIFLLIKETLSVLVFIIILLFCISFWSEYSLFLKIILLFISFYFIAYNYFSRRIKNNFSNYKVFGLSTLLLSFVFYPGLDKFRAGKEIGEYFILNHPKAYLITYGWSSHELDFKLKRTVPVFHNEAPFRNHLNYFLVQKKEPIYLIIPHEEWIILNKESLNNINFKFVTDFTYMNVTRFQIQTFIPKLRSKLKGKILLFSIHQVL